MRGGWGVIGDGRGEFWAGIGVGSLVSCLHRKLISTYMKPETLFSDIFTRDFKAEGIMPLDLYSAGFPCQPFSRNGLRQGVADAQGRGVVILRIIEYLLERRPRSYILENVKDRCWICLFEVPSRSHKMHTSLHFMWCTTRSLNRGRSARI